MTDIPNEITSEVGSVPEKKAPLWPVAVVILGVVFVPTLLAWLVSALTH